MSFDFIAPIPGVVAYTGTLKYDARASFGEKGNRPVGNGVPNGVEEYRSVVQPRTKELESGIARGYRGSFSFVVPMAAVAGPN